MALPTGVFSSSLSELYLECIQLFGEFLLALSEKDCRVICLEQVHLSKILEEYGRTKVWGDQTKANLPARARGSLDDTLRHDTELKHLVQAILMRLKALLSQAVYIARRKHDPVLGSDYDSISSVSADSDSDSNDDGGNQHYRMPKIRLLVQQTLEQIRSLYDLSALLRRPKIVDKYIRSVNSESHVASLNNPYHLPLSVAFSRSDEAHIIEKVLQWRSLTKSAQGIDFEFEGVALVGQGLTKYCVEDIPWFCQRLAAANTRRREQFQYWNDHPYDSRQDTIHAARLATPRLEEKQEPQNRASTFQPSIPKVPREGPKSTASKQSFSTAAVSDIHDTKTNVRPRTIYAPTAIGQGRFNSVPDPPKTVFGTTFPCPYCGTTLESSEMQNRQSWKRHVFRDLRPYVCTFEDCQNGGKLYVSRHDWIYHELQIHRRNYVCKVCQEMCSSRKEMSVHIREHYDDSMSPSQLGVILDLCNRQVDIADYEKNPCLICGEELSLPVLQGHLAAHMEDIALFVLPNTNEEEDVGDSKASVQVAKLKSKGQISGTESELSSLGYSAAGDDKQIPTDFSKLLTSEEAGYTSKILSWRRRDDDQTSTPVKEMMTNNTNLGEDHPDTLAGMKNLALTYWNQGWLEKAEQLQAQVMETYKTKLGEDHPDTLASITNLALTYMNQGRWEEAEPLQVQVLETYKTKLGEDHPDTLAGMKNLALTYWNQGWLEKAEQLQVQVMETYKTTLGEDHPDTLVSMTILAETYIYQGRLEEAEQLQAQVMETYKTTLGEDHPDTLASITNLALTYTNQGRWEEAEPLQVQVLETYKTKLGEDHPDTLASITNLALTYTNQGRWEEAEPLQVQVLETYKTTLGEHHPDTLAIMTNLALTYMNQGRWEEAEQLQVQVMETYMIKFGEEHPDTLASITNLASTYVKKGRLEEAKQLELQLMEIRKTQLGEHHPDTLSTSELLLARETESPEMKAQMS